MRIGALCAGYGGLDLGVKAVWPDAELAWVSEIDKGARKVLEHRFPGVPNLGDMTAVDWSTVPPVDVLTGGTPCQDLSHAGKRAGMTEGTRSNLWVAMREAVAQLRPRLVIWENVRGAYSAGADSDLEHRPGLLGEVVRRDGDPVLRALGRVLGDLSSLGFVGGWCGLRAADVGAPHGRFRVFVVAVPAEHASGDSWGLDHGDHEPVADAERGGRERRGPLQQSGPSVHAAGDRSGSLLPTPRTSDTNGAGAHGEGGVDLRTAVSLLPTPRATDGTKGGPNQRGSSGDLMPPSAVTLLPTPAVNDMGASYTPDEDAWCAEQQAKHGNGNGHGKSLSIESQRLLPTPTSSDAAASGAAGYNGNESCTLTDAAVRQPERWGEYEAAVTRWEALTRPAPAPTIPDGRNGAHRLNPALSEWMMGLPAGWVTDTPGITRNEALRALGNGVVPQQAAAAIGRLLPHLSQLVRRAAA